MHSWNGSIFSALLSFNLLWPSFKKKIEKRFLRVLNNLCWHSKLQQFYGTLGGDSYHCGRGGFQGRKDFFFSPSRIRKDGPLMAERARNRNLHIWPLRHHPHRIVTGFLLPCIPLAYKNPNGWLDFNWIFMALPLVMWTVEGSVSQVVCCMEDFASEPEAAKAMKQKEAKSDNEFG